MEGDDEDGELVFTGYVASRVDADTWFREVRAKAPTVREEGQGHGGPAMVPPLRVLHVDVENELVDALHSSDSVQPDFAFALQSIKAGDTCLSISVNCSHMRHPVALVRVYYVGLHVFSAFLYCWCHSSHHWLCCLREWSFTQ